MLTLTLVSISAYSRLSLPAVSYITSIDIWSLTCLMFVAAALLECVIVNFLAFRKTKQFPAMLIEQSTMLIEKEHQEAAEDIEKRGVATTRSQRAKCCCCESRMHGHERIKRYSRVAFPMLFLVFNIVFWGNAHKPYGLGY